MRPRIHTHEDEYAQGVLGQCQGPMHPRINADAPQPVSIAMQTRMLCSDASVRGARFSPFEFDIKPYVVNVIHT